MNISGILINLLETYKNILGSYGLSIILLVLTVKIVLFPLTVIGQKAMMKTQKIQPEMQEINKKYKSNLEMRNKKITELYAENDVSAFSPFLTCLPLLVSWPVIIALFQLLQIYFKTFSAQGIPVSFLWILDISTGNHIVLAFLVMLIQGISMVVTNKLTDAPKAPYMNFVSGFMTLFIGWLSFTYPASLGIYWFSFTFFSMIEQIFVRKFFLKKSIIINKK